MNKILLYSKKLLFKAIVIFLKAVFNTCVLSAVYFSHYLGEGLYIFEEAMTRYAMNRGLLKGGELSGNSSKLKDYLKKNQVVTVKAIRDLGFSANKSVNVRKNLEKFGIIRTNPQLDNRGEVVANDEEIDRVLCKVSEDIFTSNPILVN